MSALGSFCAFFALVIPYESHQPFAGVSLVAAEHPPAGLFAILSPGGPDRLSHHPNGLLFLPQRDPESHVAIPAGQARKG